MSAERLLRAVRLAAFAAPLALTACDWFTTFSRQPSLHTWQAVNGDTTKASRGNPEYSVPITGTVMAGYQVAWTDRMPTAIDSFVALQNPHQPTEASLENGRKYYQINCAVCHGESGGDPNPNHPVGDGPAAKVGLQFGFLPPSLLTDKAKGYSDGYLFGMIRNGRGLMPPYNRIEEPDRWDVVNYVRGLQGKLGHPVPTGPLAEPGVTGDKVPGATRMGPTVPAPFYNQWKHATAASQAADTTKAKAGSTKGAEGTR